MSAANANVFPVHWLFTGPIGSDSVAVRSARLEDFFDAWVFAARDASAGMRMPSIAPRWIARSALRQFLRQRRPHDTQPTHAITAQLINRPALPELGACCHDQRPSHRPPPSHRDTPRRATRMRS